MVDDLNTILDIWDKQISKFSPTMVDDLNIILDIWNKQISGISPAMVDDFKCNLRHLK